MYCQCLRGRQTCRRNPERLASYLSLPNGIVYANMNREYKNRNATEANGIFQEKLSKMPLQRACNSADASTVQ